jgi:hypothetical protein
MWRSQGACIGGTRDIGCREIERGSMYDVGPTAMVSHFVLNTSAYEVVYRLIYIIKIIWAPAFLIGEIRCG